jgi:hypothetical protein
VTCTHETVYDKVYSGERQPTLTPKWAWICAACGAQGYDQQATPPRPIDMGLYIRTAEKWDPALAEDMRSLMAKVRRPAGPKPRKAADISDRTVLEFLAQHQGRWATHGEGYSMPTVADAMPVHTPHKLQLAKMRALHKRGFVGGCCCGCRGDWEITDAGLAFVGQTRAVRYNGYGEAGGIVVALPATPAGEVRIVRIN